MATSPIDIVNHLRQSPASSQWERIGIRNHHGIALPLSALHSKQSCGIGEFLDLLPLVNWCSEVGFDIIQLLPLNDSGFDPSPYNAHTAFGLNPVYLSLTQLPHFNENAAWQSAVASLQELNHRQQIPYHSIYAAKEQILRQYWAKFGTEITRLTQYENFVKNNSWLTGYGLFLAMKMRNANKHWREWPEDQKNMSHEKQLILEKECEKEIQYHSFIQYLCFHQMETVKNEADKKNISIMGDIPILLSSDSDSVWMKKELFHMDLAAGAPPDMFSAEGQYWGFPIYNWEVHQIDHYRFWKERLDVASRLYHMYRLDHVLGFYRIWAIPIGKKGNEGFFFPRDESTWIAHGEKVLRFMLEFHQLMPIAEDLGAVSPEIRANLYKLGIPGIKVMRWERYWDTPEQPFIDPKDYGPVSMTTVSTHDSETLRLWWHDLESEARAFAKKKGNQYDRSITREQLHEMLKESHQSGSLFHINPLQEYLAVVPEMTWPDPRDERVNLPGTVSQYNWTYRFVPSVEEIVSSEPLQALVHDVLGKS
jgi:4-alpha-glucanotransferase